MNRLIDADALIAEMHNVILEDGEDRKIFYEVIERQPTIEPERKNGEWMEFDSDEDRYDIIKCPCCKHTFTVDSFHWTDIGFVKDDFKFCPNCGADMRGEQDDQRKGN